MDLKKSGCLDTPVQPPVQQRSLGNVPYRVPDAPLPRAFLPVDNSDRGEISMTPNLVLAPSHAGPSSFGSLLAGQVGDRFAATRDVSTLLLLSAGISLACCLFLFDRDFIDGSSPFWRDPHGAIDASWADMAQALSGYDYFVRDGWRLPLFQVSRLGAPGGSNIIYTDSTPIVALAGRLLFWLSGRVFNPFGLWTALCFVASAVSMTLLAARLGARSLASAIASTAFGLCSPALLARWGHTTLMAQFEVTLALAFYFGAVRATPGLPRLLWAVPLCVLAMWTHAYLFVMVVVIVAAAIAQALLDHRLRPASGFCLTAGLGVLLAAQLILSGYLAAPGALSAPGFGIESANLLSPIFPDRSLLGTLIGLKHLDPTGEQNGAYCYLGAGPLLLLWRARRSLIGKMQDIFARHACLLAALLACILFAVSNDIFLGNLHILHVPLPSAILTLAGVFRASGRFVWPAMYLAMALGIAGCAASRHGRQAAMVLLVAAFLQCVDTVPLWAEVEHSLHSSVESPVNAIAWEAAISRHSFVRVTPVLGCFQRFSLPLGRILTQIQLIAGRLNVATNNVYSARPGSDCPPTANTLQPSELQLRWLGDPMQPRFDTDLHCTTAYELAVCSMTLDAADRAALLPRVPLM